MTKNERQRRYYHRTKAQQLERQRAYYEKRKVSSAVVPVPVQGWGYRSPPLQSQRSTARE